MKRISIILLLLTGSAFSYSCTTFVMKTPGGLVFGRNLDWVSDNGIIVVNKKNTSKTSLSLPPDKSIKWTSKYGSITFNQFGKEFPFGGMNEKGLVVEIMTAGAEYPLADERPAVNELQWIQYQLDNSKSIEDVISSDAVLRISKIKQNLHFLICDSLGNTAVIEFKNNKMHVFKGKDLPVPVLENDAYSKSMNYYKSKQACRFTTAANMVENFKADPAGSNIDYSFSILNKVALSGSWSIVYDIKNMRIYFKTASHKNVQAIDFNAFDFDCKTESLSYNLKKYHAGIINPFFTSFTSTINQEKMKDAFSTNKIYMPKNLMDKFYNYHKDCKCLAVTN